MSCPPRQTPSTGVRPVMRRPTSSNSRSIHGLAPRSSTLSQPPNIITASYVSARLGGDPSEKLCSSTVWPSPLAVVENDPEGTSLSWIKERMRITGSGRPNCEPTLRRSAFDATVSQVESWLGGAGRSSLFRECGRHDHSTRGSGGDLGQINSPPLGLVGRFPIRFLSQRGVRPRIWWARNGHERTRNDRTSRNELAAEIAS